MPGNRPASVRPRNQRAAIRPDQLCTKPIKVMLRPQSTMMMAMKRDGRSRLSKTLVRGSNTEYDTKKMVSVALNCDVERPRSWLRPAILALPMLARSRKARR